MYLVKTFPLSFLTNMNSVTIPSVTYQCRWKVLNLHMPFSSILNILINQLGKLEYNIMRVVSLAFWFYQKRARKLVRVIVATVSETCEHRHNGIWVNYTNQSYVSRFHFGKNSSRHWHFCYQKKHEKADWLMGKRAFTAYLSRFLGKFSRNINKYIL